MSALPVSRTPWTAEPEAVPLEAPQELVARYLELTAQRRELEEKLAYVRAELEMVAASSLDEGRPRGRFRGPAGGAVAARLQPTCVFDRQEVARELQRQGRLADVAVLQGPTLARFLAKEPSVAARLAPMVRFRKSVVLMAAQAP